MSKRHGSDTHNAKSIITHLESDMLSIMIKIMLMMSDRLTDHHRKRRHESLLDDPILDDQGVPSIAQTIGVIVIGVFVICV